MNVWAAPPRFTSLWTALALAGSLVVGCKEPVPSEVVVYSAIPHETARPIFSEFADSTGIIVRPKYKAMLIGRDNFRDTLVSERDEPRCDVFWNDDILGTLLLERDGVLQSSPPVAGDPHSAAWHAMDPEARVLIVNINQVAEPRRPKSIEDLIDPQWYDRVAIAKPLSGRSATQAACLFQAWGDAKAQEFYHAVKRNAQILATDREVAQTVAAGQFAFGLTNASDAARELAAGAPVTIIYPDQGAGQLGTLFIPSTVALIKGSPHPEPAQELLEYLLSPTVNERLKPADVASDGVRKMQVDFNAVANEWDAASQILAAEFAAP